MENADKELKKIIEFVESFIDKRIRRLVDEDAHLQTTPDSYSFFVKVKDKTTVTEQKLNDQIVKDLEDAGELSFYMHFPYCHAKCKFCHYASLAGGNDVDLRHNAIDLLTKEFNLFIDKFPMVKNKKISSLYVGGGTPSLMEKDCIDKLKSAFAGFTHNPFTSDCERTIEATPESLTDDKIDLLVENFNRISIGVQTLDEAMLDKMDRKGDKRQIVDALSILLNKSSKKNNIKTNVDFMYGFPFNGENHQKVLPIEQLLKRFVNNMIKDLDTVISIGNGPDSITLYRLRLKRVGDLESPLMKEFEKSPEKFPDQLFTYKMKYAATLFLESNGYQEGPIGWFIKNENRKPIKIYADRWQKQIPLFGFGLASYSYTKNIQYRNVKDYEMYKYYIEIGNELPIFTGQIFDEVNKLKKEISYRLKQNDQINISKVQNEEIKVLLNEFIDKGFLEKKNSNAILSTIGNILIEEIISGYIWEDVKIICCH